MQQAGLPCQDVLAEVCLLNALDASCPYADAEV